MTNMAIFFSSVASLPRKITEKNGKNDIFETTLKHMKFERVYSKTAHDTLRLNFKYLIFEKNWKKSVM